MSEPQEKEAPSWLNQTFLENALKKSFKNDDLKVLDVEVKPATAAAENYGSQLLRVSVVIKGNKDAVKEKLSFVAKLVTPGEMGKELGNLQVYDKEADAFATVLPVIDSLIKDAYPNHMKLWADCYYQQKFPNYVLILEDLRVKGFTLASRFEGLDMEHAVLALKSLAKLHAASLIWKNQNPDKFDFYVANCWNSKNAGFLKKTLSAPFEILSEDVLEWTEYEEREIVSKKLKNFGETVLDKLFEVWQLNPSKLNVLLHGDAWLNNFMFKYDPNGKLAGINFVDFQLMTVNNPAMDLQYFIATSVSPNIRFDYVDLFLQVYYETFEDALRRLGHQLEMPYSFEQLKKDFEERYLWGLTVFCVVYPILLVPSSEAFHPDEFLKSGINDNYARAYKKKSLRGVLIRGFRYFEEKGVF